MIAAPPPVYPWPIGIGPRYHPTAYNATVGAGRPVGGLRCTSGGASFAVHVELFARRRVVIVPPAIGLGPRGCTYPLRTTAPTGVVHVAPARLDARRPVPHLGPAAHAVRTAVVPGTRLGLRRRAGACSVNRALVRLTNHAQIVLEVGGYVAPHPSYLFPKGDG